MKIISRREAGLPIFPDSYYPGPFPKIGVCLHHMAVGSPGPVDLGKAKQQTLSNYRYHRSHWDAIDILEAYDLYDVRGRPVIIEGRPWWSNCDAFSGMKKLGYRYIGLEVYGNYERQTPSDAILEGIVEFLVYCYRAKKITSLEMKGHRDFNHLSNIGPSSCPGRYLYPLIPEIVEEARKRLNQPEEEEEEEMPRFEIVRTFEAPGVNGEEVNWRVYACARVHHSNRLDIHAEAPGHDYSLFVYRIPIGPAPGNEMEEIKVGGWDNTENRGSSFYLHELFGECGDFRCAIHSPVPLAIEISK